MSFSTLIDPAVNQGVGVAFTDRFGGVSPPPFDSLNLGRSDVDDPENLARNFQIVSDLIGVRCIAICSQVHGAHVEQVTCVRSDASCRETSGHCADGRISSSQRNDTVVVDSGDIRGRDPGRVADGLVTTTPGIALAIRVADCVPVLLADSKSRVIAAAHAGRVGLLSGILQNTVAAMRALGATHIQAWIGPHVCPACYEVPPDMAAHAWTQIPATRAISRSGTPALDLGCGAQSILEAESVCVTRCDPCTSCDPRFFSHRRDHGQTGRQAGLIWLSPHQSLSPPLIR